MSRSSDQYLRGVPTKPYDLLREGLIVLAVIAVVVVVLAIALGAPEVPTVNGQDVATKQPVAYLKTCADILSGASSLQDYGPPYTADVDNAQRFLGIAPATWSGVRIPIDAAKDLVITPLARVAEMNKDVAKALATFSVASDDAKSAWLKAYGEALDKATVSAGIVTLSPGDYGPVAVMMDGMLALGRAGLLEGALESDRRLPYSLDTTKALLFFQDDVDRSAADSLNMTGDQWGITHEAGGYPGAWWLWPYAIWYQFAPFNALPNADLIVGSIMVLIFLLIVLTPFIPGLNQLPRLIGFHRIVWRDWYARARGGRRSGRK